MSTFPALLFFFLSSFSLSSINKEPYPSCIVFDQVLDFLTCFLDERSCLFGHIVPIQRDE